MMYTILMALALLIGGGDNPVPIQGSGHIVHVAGDWAIVDGVTMPAAALDHIPSNDMIFARIETGTEQLRTEWTGPKGKTHIVITLPDPGEDDLATARRHMKRVEALEAVVNGG